MPRTFIFFFRVIFECCSTVIIIRSLLSSMKMGLLRCVFFINDSNAAEEEEAGGVLCEAVGVVWLDWIWIWYGGKEVFFLKTRFLSVLSLLSEWSLSSNNKGMSQSNH